MLEVCFPTSLRRDDFIDEDPLPFTAPNKQQHDERGLLLICLLFLSTFAVETFNIPSKFSVGSVIATPSLTSLPSILHNYGGFNVE